MANYRACHKLLEISQRVARNFAKICSKVAFSNESCSKVATESKNFFFCLSLLLFGMMQKYVICTTKVEYLSIFVQFCIVTNVAE